MDGGGGLSGVELALILVLYLGPVLLLIGINVSKSKYWTAFFGLAIHPLWFVGAFRLAKPDSHWARQYDREKMNRAMGRFPKRAGRVPADWEPPIPDEPEYRHPQDSDPWPDEDPALWDRTTRRAYKKKHGQRP